MATVPGNTPDPRAELAAALRHLAPEIIVDGHLDVEKLRELLGDDVGDDPERFGLTWPGKREAQRAAVTTTTATLKPLRAQSKDWDGTQNVLIEGDNLVVLKILQKHYHGRVKLIYIDPPYNTGRDFIYPDDYADSLKTYRELTKQVDQSGKRLHTNSESQGRFHSNWLSMMYPRLRLARTLLTQDGVILISINDVEQARLRQLCDEIFGERNFVAQFVWVNDGNVDQQSRIKGVHEYVLAYARNAAQLNRPRVIDPNVSDGSKLYNDTIENSITKNGPANPPSTVELPDWFPVAFQEGRILKRNNAFPHILDEIEVKDGQLVHPVRLRSGWSSRNLLDLFIKNGGAPIQDLEGRQTWFELRETGSIYMLKRRADDQGHVVSVLRNLGTTKQNSSLLASWGLRFSYPKPEFLIEYLVTVFTRPDEAAIVLDFFCGSATTGHAVMSANHRDDGNRRHIQVQLPEPAKALDGTPTTIAELARQRLDRAGQAIGTGDVGYRVFRLSESHFAQWRASSDVDAKTLTEQLLSQRDSVSSAATSEDLLTEITLKLGFSLTEAVTQLDVAGLPVMSMRDGQALACVGRDHKPTLGQLEALVAVRPQKLLLLEDALDGDDELRMTLESMCTESGIELWTA